VLKVSKGDVGTQLAVDVGNVSITNGNLVVDGYVTASELSAETAKFNNLVSGSTQAAKLWAVDIKANNVEIGSGNSGTLKYHGTNVTTRNALSVDGTKTIQVLGLGLDDTDSGLDALSGAFNGCNINANGGQIKFTFYKLGGGYVERNFNIADTAYYNNAMSAQWAAARAKVEMPSKGTGTSFTVKAPSTTQGEQQTYTFTIQKGATPGPSGYASVALGQTVVGRISIGDWYTAGKEAASGSGLPMEPHSLSRITLTAADLEDYDVSAITKSVTVFFDDEDETEYDKDTIINATAVYNAGWDAVLKGSNVDVRLNHYDASANIKYWDVYLKQSDGTWKYVLDFAG